MSKGTFSIEEVSAPSTAVVSVSKTEIHHKPILSITDKASKLITIRLKFLKAKRLSSTRNQAQRSQKVIKPNKNRPWGNKLENSMIS